MKLYTKTGDAGQTGLFGGQRVSKDHPRVSAYGDVDETNAAIGFAACATTYGAETCKHLRLIQADLFCLAAQLANPTGKHQATAITEKEVARLEKWIDSASAEVEPLKSFILPGGVELSTRLHLARTVCRRAERSIVALAQNEPINPLCVVYVNRLSDLLFAWARRANHRAGVNDITWNGKRNYE